MQKIIVETEQKAYPFLKKFGFDEKEIPLVVAKGIFDLETIIDQLKVLFPTVSENNIDELDNLLHGMKGLLVQLGNYGLVEEIEKLRNYQDIRDACDSIHERLFYVE